SETSVDQPASARASLPRFRRQENRPVFLPATRALVLAPRPVPRPPASTCPGTTTRCRRLDHRRQPPLAANPTLDPAPPTPFPACPGPTVFPHLRKHESEARPIARSMLRSPRVTPRIDLQLSRARRRTHEFDRASWVTRPTAQRSSRAYAISSQQTRRRLRGSHLKQQLPPPPELRE